MLSFLKIIPRIKFKTVWNLLYRDGKQSNHSLDMYNGAW